MNPFVYQVHSNRVVFGVGSRHQLSDELRALGVNRVLVLTTPEQTKLGVEVASTLQVGCVGVYDKAKMHVPADVSNAAVQAVRDMKVDACIAVGGGSTVGLGKAIALETGLPIIALPTTYAGSEMTPLYGITDGGIKKTGRDWRVMPRTVIYDPELTVGLPLGMSLTSGMNAIAHAAEGLYAPDRNPIHALMAEEGIRTLARALPRLHTNPADMEARSDALCGAWLCGAVLGQLQMGLHHKLCHTLGGSFNLPHAETHTIVLAHALAYNAATVPEAMERMARAMGVEQGADVPAALWHMCKDLGMTLALRDIGMPKAGLEKAVDIIVSAPYPNPRPFERDAIAALLHRAWTGEMPC